MSIYSEMVNAGIETGYDMADLIVQDDSTTRAILTNHGHHVDGYHVKTFTGHDGTKWLNIHLAYAPFFQRREG